MKESQVLILGLTNCCTELARHLILSGINLKLLAFKSENKVGANEFEDEFLLGPEDVGKKKGEVIVNKLSEMNPFSKISYDEIEAVEGLREYLKQNKFTAVVYGLSSSFAEAMMINDVTREG